MIVTCLEVWVGGYERLALTLRFPFPCLVKKAWQTSPQPSRPHLIPPARPHHHPEPESCVLLAADRCASPPLCVILLCAARERLPRRLQPDTPSPRPSRVLYILTAANSVSTLDTLPAATAAYNYEHCLMGRAQDR